MMLLDTREAMSSAQPPDLWLCVDLDASAAVALEMWIDHPSRQSVDWLGTSMWNLVGAKILERLEKLKEKFDPSNTFRHEQSVPLQWHSHNTKYRINNHGCCIHHIILKLVDKI